jgi:hypothetical protein
MPDVSQGSWVAGSRRPNGAAPDGRRYHVALFLRGIKGGEGLNPAGSPLALSEAG